MSSLKFPASLKPIVSKGYSMTRRNNVWSVDLAGGGVRQGRDTYYDVFPISVTLITSALGRQAFLSFLEKVDGGASSFWMAHDFGMGIEDYQVTITSTIAESTEDGINWTITFTATAEKSPFQDQENQCLINNLPDLYGCYGDCLGSFLKIYANYETTFPRIWSNEGPAGHPPINLLASTLDSRIVYEGSQIYYINRNGNLVQSAANEWPLTFIDGTAVGRVPPEKAATNVVEHSNNLLSTSFSRTRTTTTASSLALFQETYAAKLTATSVSGNHHINKAEAPEQETRYSISAIIKADEYQSAAVAIGNRAALDNFQYAYVDLASGYLISGDTSRSFVSNLGGGWYHVSMSADTNDSGGLIYSQINMLSPSNSLTFTGDDVSGFIIALIQMEPSEFASSPIVTEESPVTRPTASAKVAMNGATSIDITYSDGSVINVQAVDGYASIPQADSAWGSKYITRIDFNVDG
nr:MAG: minor tail protein [Bacteriophage sp.]